MSNDLVRMAQKSLDKPNTTMTYEAGKGLSKLAVGSTLLYAGAGVMPFITFPMLLIIAFIASTIMLVKG